MKGMSLWRQLSYVTLVETTRRVTGWLFRGTPLVPKHSYELFATLGAGSLTRHSSWPPFTGKEREAPETSSPVCAWFQGCSRYPIWSGL